MRAIAAMEPGAPSLTRTSRSHIWAAWATASVNVVEVS